MELERIKTLKLEKNDVLVVEVDFGSLPPNRAKQWVSEVKDSLKAALGDIPMMIIPMHRVKISAINVQDAIVKEAPKTAEV